METGTKKKPARRQVEAPVTGHEPVQNDGTYNIWTGRKLREFRAEKKPREVSKYRCRPPLDAGWTRGEAMDVAYCCLYFARGLCHHGSDCNYLHRVPTEADERRHQADYGHDIFGRDRQPESRDGRKKGVGSYERECRTLYINYGGAGPTPVLELRKLLQDNFGEWGPIEDIHVVPSKAIAFVRYSWRSSAEFAKVAMHQQSLTGSRLGEILDVRWANDDPNPRAVERVKREREEAFRDAYVQAVHELAPEQKLARLHQLNLQANVRPGATTSAYPDTNAQYGHGYTGWDAYYYAQGAEAAEAAQRHYEQQFLGGVLLQQGSGGAGGSAAAAGGPSWQGQDDIARYLPPDAWAAAQEQRFAAAGGADEDEEEIPEELLEFTPDLIGADTQGAKPPAAAAAGKGPGPAAALAAAAVPGTSAVEALAAAPVAASPSAAAADALGLIGGYGSSSEEEGGR